MSFKEYSPQHTGSKGLDGCISLSVNRINFGKMKPPFEYIQIEYDTENTAIRFSKGDVTSGYKVRSRKNAYSYKNAYFINCASFAKKKLLPTGLYKKVGNTKDTEWTYQQNKQEQK